MCPSLKKAVGNFHSKANLLSGWDLEVGVEIAPTGVASLTINLRGDSRKQVLVQWQCKPIEE